MGLKTGSVLTVVSAVVQQVHTELHVPTRATGESFYKKGIQINFPIILVKIRLFSSKLDSRQLLIYLSKSPNIGSPVN